MVDSYCMIMYMFLSAYETTGLYKNLGNLNIMLMVLFKLLDGMI